MIYIYIKQPEKEQINEQKLTECLYRNLAETGQYNHTS
jgi:hypothetical protein